MRNFWIVLQQTYLDSVRNKSYISMTIILILLGIFIFSFSFFGGKRYGGGAQDKDMYLCLPNRKYKWMKNNGRLIS